MKKVLVMNLLIGMLLITHPNKYILAKENNIPVVIFETINKESIETTEQALFLIKEQNN